MRCARYLLVLGLGLASSVRAEPDVSDWLREGVELRKQGRDQAAYELFARAFSVSPSPRAAAQLGLAEQALGRWAEAERHLRVALDGVGDPWIERHRVDLEESIRYIAEHVGALEVGGTAGAELRVDGQVVGVLPLSGSLRLTEGKRIIEARLAGHVAQTHEITIQPEAVAVVRVDLLVVPPPLVAKPVMLAPPPTVVATPRRSPLYRRWWLWSAVGVAVAAIAVGVGVGLAERESSRSWTFPPPILH
jgi:hypothetical protein